MADKPYLQEVKDQYEALPYPPRDPQDELRRLVYPDSGSLLLLNHHCYKGRRDFRSGFRCLVAGGGTGDTTIYLAEQLRDYDAEVVYLDLSAASREIAQARAAIRGLKNITWVSASILELGRLGLGEFDYIECGGVLHHLESTEAGLAALNGSLKDDGAIFLMLYARYGRQPVYDMQALLRAYLPSGLDIRQQVGMARDLLAALPKTNSFLRSQATWSEEIATDAGLYDLLLHTQDRCFDVPALYELARGSGLHLLGFAVNAGAYDPLSYVDDPPMIKRLSAMELPYRQAVAEQLAGSIIKHEFFLARRPDRCASLRDDENGLRSYGSLLANAPRIAAEMVPSPGRVMQYEDLRHTLHIPCTPATKFIFAHMDGKTSLKSMRKRACRVLPGLTPRAFDQELRAIYDLLHPRGYLYLIRAGHYGVCVPDYATLGTRRH